MSTRYDILDAKARLAHHMGVHKCGELTACNERTNLRAAYMATSDKWGTEPDDDARQREQFSQRVATGSST